MNPLQIAGSILGAALAVGAAGIAWHCWTVTQEYATFKDGVAKAGKEAKAKADKKEADDKLAKEKADAQNKTDRARIADLAKRLRDERASRSFLPPASPLATSPSRAAFDRGKLEQAIRQLDEGVSRIIEAGDNTRIELDIAKKWAQHGND